MSAIGLNVRNSAQRRREAMATEIVKLSLEEIELVSGGSGYLLAGGRTPPPPAADGTV
jgi:hypothetical protein